MSDHDERHVFCPKLKGGFITVFHPGKVEIPVADLKHVFDVLDDDDDSGQDPDNRVGWGLLYFGTPPLIAMNAMIL